MCKDYREDEYFRCEDRGGELEECKEDKKHIWWTYLPGSLDMADQVRYTVYKEIIED